VPAHAESLLALPHWRKRNLTLHRCAPGFLPHLLQRHSLRRIEQSRGRFRSFLIGSNLGTVFKLNTDGTGYTVLKHFSGSDGKNPTLGLTLSGTTLYGTTWKGGSFDLGTVFKIELSESLTPIPLTAQADGSAIILSWSNPALALQEAPDVTGPYTKIQGATSPYTNAITATQRFFRLIGN
jgi:uncharacterized repeat protein (TIGR03803 family)